MPYVSRTNLDTIGYRVRRLELENADLKRQLEAERAKHSPVDFSHSDLKAATERLWDRDPSLGYLSVFSALRLAETPIQYGDALAALITAVAMNARVEARR